MSDVLVSGQHCLIDDCIVATNRFIFYQWLLKCTCNKIANTLYSVLCTPSNRRQIFPWVTKCRCHAKKIPKFIFTDWLFDQIYIQCRVVSVFFLNYFLVLSKLFILFCVGIVLTVSSSAFLLYHSGTFPVEYILQLLHAISIVRYTKMMVTGAWHSYKPSRPLEHYSNSVSCRYCTLHVKSRSW